MILPSSRLYNKDDQWPKGQWECFRSVLKVTHSLILYIYLRMCWNLQMNQFYIIYNILMSLKKNLNIEKTTYKFVQMKFLAMHITNQKISFYIFTVGNLQNIFMEHDLYLISYDFWHKRKINHFDPYTVLLAIATNIPQRLNISNLLC